MKSNSFKNLRSALKKQSDQRLTDFISTLKKVKSLEDIKGWVYTDLIPAKKTFATIKEAKQYLIERKTLALSKSLDKEYARLNIISLAPEFEKMTITVEWKKNRTWGSNPRAEARAITLNGVEILNSGSIGGCGYDKGSTAVANVINQCKAFLKLLCTKKDKKADKSNREIFGYGSGYGIIPSIEGGVGVSCYPAICKSIGLEFKTIASGKSFDVYEISR